jgi:outer membrane protein OmpA-like peptidoglycan-associated protein
MPLVLFGAVFALVLLFGPSPADETVVLLPGPDGKVGKVVVRHGSSQSVLEEPYALAHASGGGQLQTGRLEREQVSKDYGVVLAALPPRPVSYVLYFVTGLDELTDESKADLRRLLDELRSRPLSDIVLIGHTDRVGTDASNDALSLQRAERVQAELLSLGIAAQRIRLAGRGEREVLVPTADGVEEPRNRRVEVNVR